jgi:hypothetical protein
VKGMRILAVHTRVLFELTYLDSLNHVSPPRHVQDVGISGKEYLK